MKTFDKRKKDLLRHELLGFLRTKFLEEKSNDLGYTYIILEEKYNIDRRELFELIAELFSSKEIQLYNITGATDNLGIVITNEGISSFSKKKYQIRQQDSERSNTKYKVDIIIPIVSIIISLISIAISIYNENENSTKIATLQDQIQLLKNENKNSVKK